MNRKEDYIEDLFRNNEFLLEEKPPRRAWSKLEDKLDLEKAKSTRRIYRYISTAAAVIAIVSMVGAITLFETSAFEGNSQAVAMNEKAVQNQELSINDNASDWRKEYAPEVESESENENEELVAKNTEISAKTEKPVAANSVIRKEKTPSNEPIISTSAGTEIEEIAAIKNEKTEEEIIVAVPSKVKRKAEKEKIAAAKPNKVDLEIEQISNASEPAIDGRRARVSKASELSNAMPQTTYSGDYSYSKSKKVKTEKPLISDFHWLLGSWKNSTENGLSYEKWEITGQKSLAANGYLIQGTDTIFIEKMELKQVRNKIFYIATLNNSKSTLKFELKSLEDNVATFENTKKSFPKEVILRKDGNNNFVITYEEEMNQLQEEQLRYRNNISNAKASRRMSRANKK